jgi:EAL domain-containing protein (putative c-di-GMP-specific phosphodiesterase class I)
MSHPGRYLDAAARRGVDLENLVLVVAESDLDEGPVVRSALLEIARTGARVAVGAFGATTASLSLLELHPFEAVWVDRQIVEGIASDQLRTAKLGAISSVARALGQRIVIDRPARPEDEDAALAISELLVIDGRIDVTSGRTPSGPAATGRGVLLGGIPRRR